MLTCLEEALGSRLAATMVPEKHYTANEKELAASLTEEGTTYAETALQVTWVLRRPTHGPSRVRCKNAFSE